MVDVTGREEVDIKIVIPTCFRCVMRYFSLALVDLSVSSCSGGVVSSSTPPIDWGLDLCSSSKSANNSPVALSYVT